jgi:prolyl 4-hydroxylase
MQLTKFIRVFDNVLSSDTCNRIIGEFENNKEHAIHHDTTAYKFDQLNLNSSGLMHISQGFIRHVVPLIKVYTQELSLESYVPIKGFEEVRIKKYKKNSTDDFKTHVDVDDKNSAVRYLIFILYLNNNNGTTTFPHLNYSYTPRQGSMIMFPPFWMFPHSGETPTDNDKYIIMSSLHYS